MGDEGHKRPKDQEAQHFASVPPSLGRGAFGPPPGRWRRLGRHGQGGIVWAWITDFAALAARQHSDWLADARRRQLDSGLRDVRIASEPFAL